MEMFLVLVGMKRGGTRKLAFTVSLRTVTAVHELFCCVLPSRRVFAFVHHGLQYSDLKYISGKRAIMASYNMTAKIYRAESQQK